MLNPGRRADVEAAMVRVEASLAEAAGASGRPSGVIDLRPEGDRDVNVGRLRHRADIAVDLPSGSDRPLMGGAIRLTKRAVRRGLRWYIWPIVDQQSRFNHATLDLIERLRLRLAGADDDRYAEFAVRAAGYRPWFEGCRRVVHLDDTTDVTLGERVGDLGAMEASSIDGAFVSLVAMPRSAPELVSVLEGAWQALRDDGILVIETMHAGDGPALSSSHGARRPLHPEAVRAALLGLGFGDVRLEASPPEDAPPREKQGPNGSGIQPSLADDVARIDDLHARRRASALIARKTAW